VGGRVEPRSRLEGLDIGPDLLRRARFRSRATHGRPLRVVGEQSAGSVHLGRARSRPGASGSLPAVLEGRQQLGQPPVHRHPACARQYSSGQGDGDGHRDDVDGADVVATGAADRVRGFLPPPVGGRLPPRSGRSAGSPPPLARVRPPLFARPSGAAAVAWTRAEAVGASTSGAGPGSTAAAAMLAHQLVDSTKSSYATS